ncbi:NAD(P)-dependent oxidoreductase [Nocardia sp. NPDC057227]|uniref:NAD(P)-dependent oxidoreductase n=1 Tax=Nocardia sp. NPDC057227 TaxID=3346056 RepID=UPI003640B01A
MTPSVTVLGQGAMGRALAAALLAAGHRTTVWNRTPGRPVPAGALELPLPEALTSDLVIVCLLDHASIHETLDPHAGKLAGRAVVNLTSTEPAGARELAGWAAGHGIEYLDGGIMATPEMIGAPGSSLLYSGSAAVFERYRPVLEVFGTAEYFGADAGHASLVDFALLAGMYTMFAGFYHGAAMVRAAGIPAAEFAPRAAAWISAVTGSLPEIGAKIDSADYAEPFQPLTFTKAALDAIVGASREAGVDLDIIGAVRNLADRQIAAGFGGHSSERMFESLNPPAAR